MPIYEYQCQQCGRRFEEMQKMSDAPLTTCSVCGGPLKKLVSSPAVQFKGSGWYVTDYARKSSAGTSGSARSEGGESKGAESGGGESKSDTKSDATKSDTSAAKS